MGKIYKPKFLIGLDLETTKLNPEEGSIIQIGICLWNTAKKCQPDLRVVASYQELFKPSVIINNSQYHGITQKAVKRLLPFTGHWYGVIQTWLQKYHSKKKPIPIVGHNLQFDRGHVNAQGVKLFQEHKCYFDSMKQIPRNGKRYESLVNAIKKYIPKDSPYRREHHKGLDDAIMSCVVAQELLVGKVEPITETDLLKK